MKKLTVGILAHVDAGKTTLSEALLYRCGTIRTLGRVDHKDSYLDGEEIERQRGVTVFSKQARFSYKDMEITLLDTPGHVDFSAEMERTLKVLDYAILVISGIDGVQSHTKTLWKLLQEYKVPTFIFVNKMDISRQDKDELLSELKEELGEGIVCLDGDEEEIATCEESLLESYLEQGSLSKEEIEKAIYSRHVFPVIFGAALKEEGVEELLETLEEYTKEKLYNKEFGALIYKIDRDKNGERLSHVKITGGKISVKELLSHKGEEVSEEKLQGIRFYNGDKFETKSEAKAGDICTFTGLKDSYAGEGFGLEEDVDAAYLEPVLSYEILPPEGIDPGKLFLNLKEIGEEDPTLQLDYSEESREIRIQLMGPFQLEVLQQEIKRRFGCVVTFGVGKIMYRETICNEVEGIGHFEPLRHYAEVHVKIEPLERGAGISVDNICSTDVLGKNYQQQILSVLQHRRHVGVLTGSTLTDVKITLLSGKSHNKHTEGGDFSQATRRAVRQGLMKAESLLLEPYYKIELRLPSQNIGRAMTDLDQMCGKIEAPEIIGDEAILRGRVPVSTSMDYATEVASYTGGLGQLTMTAAGYDVCHNPEEVILEKDYRPEEDRRHPTGSVFCSGGVGYIVPASEVEEKMHLPYALSNEDGEKEEFYIPQKIKEADEKNSKKVYDGYGGLTSDLEEIFVREFGPIRSPIAYSQIKERDYNKPKEKPYKPRKYEKKKRYILVDGYNVIFAWEYLNDLAKMDLSAARGKLMDILCDYQGYVGDDVIVVFDAYRVQGNPGSSEKYHNIYVVYTKEAQTADSYIERSVHEMIPKHEVTVVTSDGAEQVIVAGAGALRISSREFYEEVKRVKAEGILKQ
ncbi:MAG: TetM/TetW/TetO/TetS family tetracycline resistance ribosomal protection protein [Lachnospiraceae bacterium]|nr:TetM/TetW/TetO/TetS family tetracycline resistance ribosomal protection protein [Lachnospiraceae bacterium]